MEQAVNLLGLIIVWGVFLAIFLLYSCNSPKKRS
jgi:hypothetical protein